MSASPIGIVTIRAMLASVCGLAVFGCGGGDGPQLTPVTGIVLLDGKPLVGARVVFQPLATGGSPSSAQTDGEGKFQLAFNREKLGAIIGRHQVRITTAGVVTDESGRETEIKELLPKRYHSETELDYEVKPGTNQFEILLDSKVRPGVRRKVDVPTPC